MLPGGRSAKVLFVARNAGAARDVCIIMTSYKSGTCILHLPTAEDKMLWWLALTLSECRAGSASPRYTT